MAPTPRHLSLDTLAPGTATDVQYVPASEDIADLVARLGLLGLKKPSLTGQIAPLGKRDWRFEASLGATVVQPCVVTLAPVTTRVEEPVVRTYVARMPEVPEGGEIEMPEDDTLEPLPDALDMLGIFEEALSLALPPYPRADGAAADAHQVTEPGKTPMTDEEARPFAGLKDLMQDRKSD
ncbi:MAG: DUF177 domain-containing protein [Pseudomonadota bacterium]